MNARTLREVLYIETGSGRRFAVVTRPEGEPVGAWLYLPPFAEEMNKSRHLAAQTALAFAERGWLVLQMDLAGCGDSPGDFGDADWTTWLDDIDHGWRWLSSRCAGPVGLWSLRGGSLLASDWIRRVGAAPPMILWQPVQSGEVLLSQFLRLKAVGALDSTDAKVTVASLRSALASGEPIEVAGYRIAPGLAEGLSAAHLSLPDTYSGLITVIEISSSDDPELSRPFIVLRDRLLDAGVAVSVEPVKAPRFWQSLELEAAPNLVTASVTAASRIAG